MLSTFTDKTYTGKGPFNGWNVLFQNGEPIAASPALGGFNGIYQIRANLRKSENERLARSLADTVAFKTAVAEKVDEAFEKDEDEDTSDEFFR